MAEKNRLGDILLQLNLINPDQLKEALAEQKKKGGYLGQILIDKGYVAASDIAKVMDKLSSQVQKKDEIGAFLVKDNLITEKQLLEAHNKQNITKQSLTKTLVDMGFVKAEELAKVFGRYLEIPYVDLSKVELKPEVVLLLPENIIRQHQVIPVELKEGVLSVAMADPLNLLTIDEIKLITNYTVRTLIATEEDINLAIDKHFGMQEKARKTLVDIRKDQIRETKEAPEEMLDRIEEGPVIHLVDSIITGAINAKASDIHLESYENEMRVRYRVDGILHEIMAIPKGIDGPVVSRIKILADMDITERRKPQDGHMDFKTQDNKLYDLRLSSFPTISGEKIVMRILDKSKTLLTLNELGLYESEQVLFNSLISRPYGIILITGPTGSGKTTSLYAMLQQFDTATKNIMTVEDPVEYRFGGVNQSQVNPAIGVSFATELRAILRQDPDIIMVGEIRDKETAEIAIQAALTGHLVLSTLHTNDAAAAMTRLLDMGIEPFLIVSSVIGVIAQRLIRVICKDCKEAYTPEKGLLQELGLPLENKYTFAKGTGCQYCLHTGYRGRIGIFEILKMSDPLQELILSHQSAAKIKETAIKEGMKTLKESALEKVINQVTTPEEIKRVIFAEEV